MRPYPGGPAALSAPKGGPGPGLRNSSPQEPQDPQNDPAREGPQPLQKRHVSAPGYRRHGGGPGPRASRPPPSFPGPRSEQPHQGRPLLLPCTRAQASPRTAAPAGPAR
ncbi:proline-rich protein HaeIII subfamily 1-like [Zalophus californianus]|uniref:Proline-rich protein HaeIII subfamily 1-like n=1 Tax=Zalophus californianus TaxID=9704 RepID=A0A6J2CEX2_ZALCA|nr:proline-rich protein HaeIII subfamily 1-like [Zalophus californianus]